MSERAEKLLGNTLIFAVSNFASKILVFLMLPLYTSYLSTGEYGIADLVVSIVTLSLPFLTLAIDDGVLRYVMDKEYEPREVFSIGVQVVTAGLIILLLLLLTFQGIELVSDNIFYIYLISIPNYYFSLFSKMARGLDQVKKVGIAGVISTVLMVGVNIVGLIIMHLGLTAYLLSYAIMYFVSALYLFFSGKLYQYLSIQSLTYLNIKLLCEILRYSIPLIPNKVSWWIVDTSNKYVINFFSGASVTGLYSAALKIPTILNTVQGFFSQAWTLSAINEGEAVDSANFYSRYHDYYNAMLFISCSLLMIFVHPLGALLYSATFEEAINMVPGLLVSSVFGGSVGFMSALFSAKKKTKFLFYSTVSGAIASLLLSVALVPLIGGYGAIAANIGAYFVIWVILLIETVRVLKIELRIRPYFISLSLVVSQALINIFIGSSALVYIFESIVLLIIMIIWWKEARSILLYMSLFIQKRIKKNL